MPNRRRFALALGALPALSGAGLLLSGCSETVTEHGPARMAIGVLRLASDQGDRLAFLTSQWERRHVYVGGRRTGSSRRSVAHLHIDFWLIDVATARPLRRVRLGTDKQLGDLAVLGADRGILWARLPDLIGVRLADGAVVADRARMAAANPALASVLPQPPDRTLFLTPQQQRLRFTLADGLVMLLDDGRRVRVDPSTLQAHALGAAAETEPEAATGAQRQRALAPANGMQWKAMVRGLNIARTDRDLDWLGLVAEREVAQIARESQTTSVPDFTRPERFKVPALLGLIGPVWACVAPVLGLPGYRPLPSSHRYHRTEAARNHGLPVYSGRVGNGRSSKAVRPSARPSTCCPRRMPR